MKKVLSLALMSVVLVGCGKDSASKTADGNCTQAFVDSFNSVGNAAESLSQSAKLKLSDTVIIERLRGLQSACQSFFAAHGNVDKCDANFVGGPSKQAIRPSMHQDTCQKADQALASIENPSRSKPRVEPSAPNPAPVPKIAASFDDAVVKDLAPNRITMKVLNSEALKQSFSTIEEMKAKLGRFIVGGKVLSHYDGQTQMEMGKTACYLLVDTHDASSFFSGAEFKPTQVISDQSSLGTLLFVRPFLAISCLKPTESPLLVRDMREALRGIVEISVSER